MFQNDFLKRILVITCLIAPAAWATDIRQQFSYTVPDDFVSVRALLESDVLEPDVRAILEPMFSMDNDEMVVVDMIEGTVDTAKPCSMMLMFAIDEDDTMDDFIGGLTRSFVRSFEPPESHVEPVVTRTTAEHHHGFELLTVDNTAGKEGVTMHTYIKQYDDGFMSIAADPSCAGEEAAINTLLENMVRRQTKKKAKAHPGNKARETTTD